MSFPFPQSLSRNIKHSSMNYAEALLPGASFAMNGWTVQIPKDRKYARYFPVSGRRTEAGRRWAHVWPWTQLYQPRLHLRGGLLGWKDARRGRNLPSSGHHFNSFVITMSGPRVLQMCVVLVLETFLTGVGGAHVSNAKVIRGNIRRDGKMPTFIPTCCFVRAPLDAPWCDNWDVFTFEMTGKTIWRDSKVHFLVAAFLGASE